MENTSCWISDSPRPYHVQFKFLQRITNDFSEDCKLGSGTFGKVYKGVLEDGELIAVKILPVMWGVDNHHFANEFENLKRLNHQNIVQLLGYCDESEETVAEYNGQLVICYRIHRALCLEYMPNGSLGNFLSGEYITKNWPTRYRIIKGICEGIKYLHEDLEVPILHLDLKPDNILLDQHMVPKIADFGLSRLIGEENTKWTQSIRGTLGYFPPEFLGSGLISREYDIFSLGVIIMKIIVGLEGYSSIGNTDSPEFTDHLYNNWRNLQEILEYALVQPDWRQVRGCIEIAVNCMNKDRRKRPKVKDVIGKLNEIELFSSLQQHPRTAPDVSNIQRMCMQRQNNAGAAQLHHDHQNQLLQQSQYNIVPQFKAQPIHQQQLFSIPEQPSWQQKNSSFANKLVQQNNINPQMQYIQAQRGLQEVSSCELKPRARHDIRNRRTAEWAPGMCGPRGAGLYCLGLNW